MSDRDPDAINRLVVEFSDLHETWQGDSAAFDWELLRDLARRGAHAYNEEAGPSFHALALDGVEHSAFHERFLEYLLQAGFDAFKLVKPGTDAAPIPVIDHADLAEAALYNASSARMQATLAALARERFTQLVQEVREFGELQPESFKAVEACAETIPLDLLQQLAPELAKAHEGESRVRQVVDPVEGYLSTAEVMVESNHRPYG